MATKKRLGEILISEGLINDEQLNLALDVQKKTEERLGDIMVSQGMVSNEEILMALKKQLNIPMVDLDEIHIKQDIIKLLPEKLARRYTVVPVKLENGELLLAMSDPSNYFAIDDIRFATGLVVKAAISSQDQVMRSIEKYYDQEKAKKAAVKFRNTVILSRMQSEKLEEELRKEAPIIQFLNSILETAIRQKASDIHIEPAIEDVRVRYRVDGFLEELLRSDIQILEPLVGIFKIMCNMDDATAKIPTDGRFLYRTENSYIDMRVSVVPTIFGDKIVIRLRKKDDALLDLSQLGFNRREEEIIEKSIRRPYGIVILCGPTGSGKTTTIYSFIKELNNEKKNIVSIEDPVEYNLEGVNQIQVNNNVGLTFEVGLRSLLRQDPDILLVGEIVDSETAEMTIRAAQTGHLVFSTIHTNNSVSTISRLKALGIQSYLLGSTLASIISQRLVRRVCPDCSVSDPATEVEKKILGVDEDINVKRAIGCKTCGMKGYKGRTAVYEVMEIDNVVKRMIAEDASEAEIEDYSRMLGMESLRESCISKVISGETTVEELVRTTL